MRRLRFSLASLLGVVLFVAVALAALRASTDLWDSCLLGLALLILLTTTLLAVHRTGRQRAFWLGFALFGWVYLLVSLIPQIESRLPTNRGLTYLDAKLPRQEAVSTVLYRLLVTGDPGASGPPQPVVADLTRASGSDWAYTWMFTGAALPGSTDSPENFVRIGHSLLALMLALIGGHLSRRLYDKNPGMAGDGDRPTDERRRP